MGSARRNLLLVIVAVISLLTSMHVAAQSLPTADVSAPLSPPPPSPSESPSTTGAAAPSTSGFVAPVAGSASASTGALVGPSATLAPSSSSAPPPSPAPSSSAVAPEKAEIEGIVRLKDRRVFSILLDRDSRSAPERAKNATQALEGAFDAKESEVRVERSGGVAIVYAGKAPIVELDEADAYAAGAATLDSYAADVRAKVRSAIALERKRSDLANTVFSFSLLVFSGLIGFLLLGKASQLAARGREWLEDHPDRIPSLRFGGVELLRAGAIEGFLALGIDIGKRIVQLGVLYAWAIFSLSLFEATKGYTDKLTGLVLGPLSAFATRIGTSLPIAVATAIGIFAIGLLVRFTGVFFAGLVRGETTLDWVPQDLAAPVGVIVRLGIIVLGLILAAPLLTGSDDGVLSRAGMATLGAFGLAATPILACGIVGSLVVFRRRLRPGDFVELAGRSGRIREVTLLEVAIEDDAGCAVRVPHLLSLVHPTRVMGAFPVVSIDLVVDPKASQLKVRDVLVEAAMKAGATPKVDLVSIDIDGALYRVTLRVASHAPHTAAPMKRSRSTPGRGGSMPSVPPPPRISMSEDGSSLSSVQLTAHLADALALHGIALGHRATLGVRTR